MVSEIASEISPQPIMNEVSMRPSVEFNPRPSTQESKAADSIIRDLNSGKPPEGIMELLVNQKTMEGKNTQPQPDNKTQPNEQRETGREYNQINTGEDGDNNIRSAQGQEEGDTNSNEQLNETEEDKFKAAVNEHMQRYGLQAPNLEADGRFQDIYEKLMKDWEEQNQEPYKGKDKLSDKEQEAWNDWAARRVQYRDEAFREAKIIFKETHQEDFNKYEEYGIYDSLDNDPRFKEIFQRNNLVQHELAKKRGSNLSQSPDQIAFVQSRDEFIRRYPEVAKIYAIKDQDIARVLEIEEKRNEQHTQPQPDTQPDNEIQSNKKEETGYENNQSNTGADGDNRRSGQGQEGGNADSNKEKTNNEPNKPEQETEIQELKKQIEALTQEIKRLREELEQLKKLGDQAGKVVEELRQNPQIEGLLKNEGELQPNTMKIIEIIIALLLASGLSASALNKEKNN